MRQDIAELDTPDLADSLEWRWVEDRENLDGISIAALRECFHKWIASEVARQPGDYDPYDVSRLRFFVMSTMKSCRMFQSSLQDSIARLTSSNWSMPTGNMTPKTMMITGRLLTAVRTGILGGCTVTLNPFTLIFTSRLMVIVSVRHGKIYSTCVPLISLGSSFSRD